MKRIALAVALLACACTQAAEQGQGNKVTQQLQPPQDAGGAVRDDGDEPQAPADVADAGPKSPCLEQDGKAVPLNAIRAIGTEPFWGASVEGRCVTYSTPEDQDGTRIWTRFSGSAENGRWEGAFDGRAFVMVTRPERGCSDGMSDTVYPVAVTLTVGGEQRRGCAKPD